MVSPAPQHSLTDDEAITIYFWATLSVAWVKTIAVWATVNVVLVKMIAFERVVIVFSVAIDDRSQAIVDALETHGVY